MTNLTELDTGQVAFLSGLMSGFAITVGVHILRRGLKDLISQTVFFLLVVTTLLFMVSLYTEVRLTIEIAGTSNLSQEALDILAKTRAVGTLCATFGYVLFVIVIGLLGWIATPMLGVLTTLAACAAFGLLAYVWLAIRSFQLIV